MKCSCCKSELVEWKMLPLETLDEHICRPNDAPEEKMAFVCPNSNCAVNNGPSKNFKILWNEFGDYYAEYDTSTTPNFRKDREYENSIPFINGIKECFGSFARQQAVEIYKSDENRILFTVPKWFPFRKEWKCKQRFYYKSNPDGDILKRKWKLEWIKSDGTHYTSGLRMIRYELRQLFRGYVNILRNPDSKDFWLKDMQETVSRKNWLNAEWWRKVNAFLASMMIKWVNLCMS